MEITGMKTWIFVMIAMRLFVDGAEEFFIAPTAWYYIHSLNQTKVFLGMVTSAYSITATIVSPFIGKFTDKFGYIKPIIVASYFVKFAGNLIYSLPFRAMFPLLGRIISGIGDGASGTLYGQVALYTKQRNLAKVFLILDGMFILGTVIGPAISSFLIFKVNILGWPIHAGNSPGVVLALIWFASLVPACFLPKEFGNREALAEHVVDSSNDSNSEEGTKECVGVKEPATKQPAVRSRVSSPGTVFCLFYVIFSTGYYAGAATFYTPLLAMQHFHLQFIHVKLLFLVSSMFAFVLFLVLTLATEHVKPKKLMALVMLQQTVPIAVLAYCVFTWHDESTESSYVLIIYICLGLPYFSFGIGSSILCQITDPKDAAFYQGMCYSTCHLALFLSRFVSGYLFTKTILPYYCLGLTSSWLLGAFWFALEYAKL